MNPVLPISESVKRSLKPNYLLTICIGCWLLIGGVCVAAESHYRVATSPSDQVAPLLFSAAEQALDSEFELVEAESQYHAISMLEEGSVDFVANVISSDINGSKIAYSSPTNLEPVFAVSRKPIDWQNKLHIGLQVHSPYKQYLLSAFPHIDAVELFAESDMFNKLNQNEIDAFLITYRDLARVAKYDVFIESVDGILKLPPASVAALKKSPAAGLLTDIASVASEKTTALTIYDTIQQAIRSARLDALDYKVKRLFPLSYSLNIALEGRKPFSFYEAGQQKGIMLEVIESACRLLKFHCTITDTKHMTWEEIESQFIQGEVDVIAPYVSSEPRQLHTYFSDVIQEAEIYVVKRVGYKDHYYHSASELFLEKLGAVKADYSEYLWERYLPNKPITLFGTQEALIEALLSKKVDYIMLDSVSLNAMLADELLPIRPEMNIPSVHSVPVAVGFSKRDQHNQVAALFSEALELVDIEKIINAYDSPPDWQKIWISHNRISTLIYVIAALIIMMACVVAVLLYRTSRTDTLTGLKNLRSLERSYSKGLKKGETVLYLDVNRFKQINDKLGHKVGDALLVLLGKRIKKHWRGKAYRVGGDEFVLIGTPTDAQLRDSQAMLEEFLVPLEQEPSSILVSVAIGIFRAEKDIGLEEALSKADILMYENKAEVRVNTERNSQPLNSKTTKIL